MIDVADRYATDAWIRQIVQEEVPCHIRVQIHWLDPDEFETFARAYDVWKSDGTPVGDRSYELLEYLGLGRVPVDDRMGIGFMQIASQSYSEAPAGSVDGSGKYTDRAKIEEAQLLYVAPAAEAS